LEGKELKSNSTLLNSTEKCFAVYSATTCDLHTLHMQQVRSQANLHAIMFPATSIKKDVKNRQATINKHSPRESKNGLVDGKLA